MYVPICARAREKILGRGDCNLMDDKKMSLKNEDRKGVVLVRYEDGTTHTLPKYIYMKMKKSGKRPNVVLLKEGLHWEDLK